MWRKTEALYCDFCGDVMQVIDNCKSTLNYINKDIVNSGSILVLKSDDYMGEDICYECCKEKGEENG